MPEVGILFLIQSWDGDPDARSKSLNARGGHFVFNTLSML